MKPRTILSLIIDEGKGGASSAGHLINKELGDRGFCTKVLIRKPEPSSYSITKLGRLLARFLSLILFPFSWRVTYRSLDIGFISKSQLHFAAAEAEIIWVHWPHDGWISLRQLKSLNKPLIWTVHDFWILHGTTHYCESKRKGVHRLLRYLEVGYLVEHLQKRRKKRLLASMNIKFHCTSLQSLAKVVDMYGESKAFYWPLKVDPTFYQTSENQESIAKSKNYRILIGASPYCFWDPRKGMHEILTGLESLPTHLSVTVVVLGICEQQCAELRHRYKLTFESAGIVQREDMSIIYGGCDVLCVGSHEETYCMMIPESLLCGTPVISRRVGVAPQIIQAGLNGLLLEQNESWTNPTVLKQIIKLAQLNRQKVINISQQTISELVMHSSCPDLYELLE